MKKLLTYALDYYDRNVISRIIDKYNMEPFEATKAFLLSETHCMLEDAENAMWEFSDRAIFDMWETERITGNPRNSLYIRGE